MNDFIFYVFLFFGLCYVVFVLAVINSIFTKGYKVRSATYIVTFTVSLMVVFSAMLFIQLGQFIEAIESPTTPRESNQELEDLLN